MDRFVEKWVEGVVRDIDRYRATGLEEAVILRRDWRRLHRLFPETLAKDGSLAFVLPDGVTVKVWCGGSVRG